MAKKTNGAAKVAAAMIATVTPQTEQIQTKPEPEKQVVYTGDKWENQYKLFNGLAFTTQRPTGDILADFGAFTFGQGGGKSRDLKDSICWARDKNYNWLLNSDGSHVINWNAFPPKPDKDGQKYHTSDDVTWLLYSSPVLAKAVGYKPTPEGFYNMPADVRTGIVKYHLDKGNQTTSAAVNAVLAYCIWGTGTEIWAVRRFNQKYGDLQNFINLKGEYFVFYELLVCRQETMYERNRSSWPVMGRGWSSGLAHFHRVFKTYCHD